MKNQVPELIIFTASSTQTHLGHRLNGCKGSRMYLTPHVLKDLTGKILPNVDSKFRRKLRPNILIIEDKRHVKKYTND